MGQIQSGALIKNAPRLIGSVGLGWLILSCVGGDKVLGPPSSSSIAPVSTTVLVVVDSGSESFAGTAGALGAPWTQQDQPGTLNRNGLGVGKGSVNAKDLFVSWNARTFNGDQFSQVRIAGGLASWSQYVQISVRSTGTSEATFKGYVFYTDGITGAGHSEVAKVINGSWTTLRSFPITFTTGDVARISVVGTTITCYKNGTSFGTVNDATLQSGAPGVGVFGSTVTIDDWQGGSLAFAAAPVAAVAVSPTSSSVAVGSTQQFTATTRDSSGNVLTGRAISWSSSNPAAVTVDTAGLATALAEGTSTITATSEGKSGSAAITVTAAATPVSSVTVDPTSASLIAGGTQQLSATSRDASGNPLTGRAVAWSSSNTSLATVSSAGLVTGVAPGGPVQVSATAEGQTGSSSITVTPAPVATVVVNPSSATISVGGAQNLTATVRDSRNNILTGRTVTWSSDAPSIASVGPSTGTVTGLAPGMATISATSEGQSGVSYVTVTQISGGGGGGAGVGPLRVSARNRRYFENAAGQIVYLTGSHTWSNLRDNGTSDPPASFDYAAYLNFLTTRGHNFFRLWAWEQEKWTAETAGPYWFSPSVYQRTGPGIALDGKPKFDLSQFNQAYFDRLRSRVQDAGARGIYVSVMLFNGWSVTTKPGYTQNNPWRGHPFNASNNVNGINGDTNGDGSGVEVQTLGSTAVTDLEDAYVRKVIDAVNDLDNVLFEIDNEGDVSSKSWQYHMIQVIRTYEAAKPNQHPIGITAMWPNGSDADLYGSGADWISTAGSLDNPSVATGSKVIISDTDHLCGICGNVGWVWKSFTRGQNPILMDGYDGTAVGVGAKDYSSGNPVWEAIRKNLGYARNYALRMNLAAAVPRGDLASTGYCLAVPGSEYLVYLPSGGSATLNLYGVSGTRVVEWLNTDTGQIVAGASVSGGSTRRITAPFSGAAVAYIHP